MRTATCVLRKKWLGVNFVASEARNRYVVCVFACCGSKFVFVAVFLVRTASELVCPREDRN